MTRWEKHLHSMTVADRIAAAKVKTDAVVNHLLWQIALRENNAIVLYSDVLSSQISGSRAVEAFKIFRSGLHLFEIIRLCTIWDKPAEAAESIPTIVELIDDTDVNAAFAHETQSKWLDPRDAGFSREQANKTRNGLNAAVIEARRIAGSQELASIRNVRDKHLAHSLSQTFAEKKGGPVAPFRYGYERTILERSCSIVEALHGGINNAGFNFDDSKTIHKKNAEALWHRCRFDFGK